MLDIASVLEGAVEERTEELVVAVPEVPAADSLCENPGQHVGGDRAAVLHSSVVWKVTMKSGWILGFILCAGMYVPETGQIVEIPSQMSATTKIVPTLAGLRQFGGKLFRVPISNPFEIVIWSKATSPTVPLPQMANPKLWYGE
jgi:hypothetical protein